MVASHHVRDNWSITGPKDRQLVRSDWSPLDPIGIEGVVAKQITNVITNDGYLTEIWRKDWELDDLPVGQVFQRIMAPRGGSGWHAHEVTTDRLFCAWGRVHVGLYDARLDSPTHGAVHDFRLGAERPAVIVVPPGIWHAVRNIGDHPAVYLNVVDVAYDYEDPDHFRIPIDSPLIPFTI